MVKKHQYQWNGWEICLLYALALPRVTISCLSIKYSIKYVQRQHNLPTSIANFYSFVQKLEWNHYYFWF